MKKDSGIDDDLRPEYDLKELLQGGVRGKYAERYRQGTNIIVLAPDVADAFLSEEAVNEALRLVMRLSKIPIQSMLLAGEAKQQASEGALF